MGQAFIISSISVLLILYDNISLTTLQFVVQKDDGQQNDLISSQICFICKKNGQVSNHKYYLVIFFADWSEYHTIF